MVKDRLEISLTGTVSGGPFQSVGASKVVFETAAVVLPALGVTTARVDVVDKRLVGGRDVTTARGGAEVATSGSEVTEGFTGALAVGRKAGFGGVEVIGGEETATVVGTVVTFSGGR